MVRDGGRALQKQGRLEKKAQRKNKGLERGTVGKRGEMELEGERGCEGSEGQATGVEHNQEPMGSHLSCGSRGAAGAQCPSRSHLAAPVWAQMRGAAVGTTQ